LTIVKITNQISFNCDAEGLAKHAPKVMLSHKVQCLELERAIHELKLDVWDNPILKHQIEYIQRRINELKNLPQNIESFYEKIENNEVIEN